MILIALGLSMDSFAVSICNGLSMKNLKWYDYIRISLIFGFIQFLFPIIGWYLGNSIQNIISIFDHWIAFLLLAYIGGKMIIESFKKNSECEIVRKDDYIKLIIMGIATSIDALVVGLSISLLNSSIMLQALLIGLITFIAVIFGMIFGQRIGEKFQKKSILIGGLILIGIGLKILIEHLIA